MTGATVLAAHRHELLRQVNRLIDASSRSNNAILHDHLDGHEEEVVFLPAVLCRGVAISLGAEAKSADLLAAAVAFLAAALDAFTKVATADHPGQGLSASDAWSMPLSLNAGDGLFSLSHSAILAAKTEVGLSASQANRALGLLDNAALSLAESHRRSVARDDEVPDRVRAALVDLGRLGSALGAVAAGFEREQQLTAFEAFGSAFVNSDLEQTSELRDAIDMLTRSGVPRASVEALLVFTAQ